MLIPVEFNDSVATSDESLLDVTADPPERFGFGLALRIGFEEFGVVDTIEEVRSGLDKEDGSEEASAEAENS